MFSLSWLGDFRQIIYAQSICLLRRWGLHLYMKQRKIKIKETYEALGVDLRCFELYGTLFSIVQNMCSYL